MSKVVLVTAGSPLEARQYAVALIAAGFASRHVSVVTREAEPAAPAHDGLATRMADDAVIGGEVVGAAGALVGGGLALLGALGAIVVPGLGALFALGPLVALLGGAAAGASVGMTAGTLSGVLVALGVPEAQAKHYQARLDDGRTLVAVHVEDVPRQHLAIEVLRRLGARDLSYSEEDVAPARENAPTPRRLLHGRV